MYLQLLTSLGISCVFCLAQVSADTVLLNNGESYEGKVIFEDDTSCLLEVVITKGIKDEKKFLKSEIKSITKQTPDIEKFKKVKELTPVPDLIEVSDYQARLAIVDEFIKSFPTSVMLKEAKEIQKALNEEFEFVRAGGIKLSGKMVTAEEYQAAAYTYDQLIAVQKINRDISSRNFLGALRMFTDYESKFPNGKTRDDLVTVMKQVLLYYQNSLNESLSTYDARVKAREAGLARMSNDDRMNTEGALEEQMENLKKRFETEKAMRVSWITPDAFHKESLVEALRQVENEIRRLNTPGKSNSDITSLEDSYSEAWAKLPGASAEDQKTILEKLKRDRMPELYLSRLKARINPEQ